MGYKIKIPLFEGPFDLLVYLIENAQMSIYDIKISDITGQYIEYLGDMRRENINISSEFMVLAAELIEIKSKMMLPRESKKEGEVTELEDPRTQLAQRLLAYKICKKQSEILSMRQEKMMGIFEKPQEDISEYLENPKELLKISNSEFIEAFHSFLDRKYRIEKTKKHYTKLERERITVEQRMEYITEYLEKNIRGGDNGTYFNHLIPGTKTRYNAVVSFVSMLQMMRENYLDAEQQKTYGDIWVKAGKKFKK